MKRVSTHIPYQPMIQLCRAKGMKEQKIKYNKNKKLSKKLSNNTN